MYEPHAPVASSATALVSLVRIAVRCARDSIPVVVDQLLQLKPQVMASIPILIWQVCVVVTALSFCRILSAK